MELILHIGTEKTGTTTFQSWMGKNGAELRRRGFWVPTAFGNGNHRAVELASREWASWDRVPALRREFPGYGVTNEAELGAFRDRVWGELRDEVTAANRSGARVFVISSEHFSSRNQSVGELARLRDDLVALCPNVTVVCVLRSQVEMVVSLASTATRAGRRVDEAWIERVAAGKNFDLEAMLDRWADAFGRDRMEVLPYRTHAMLSERLPERAGIDASGLRQPPSTNSAIDIRTMALINRFGGGEVFDEARLMIDVLDALPVERRLTIDRAHAKALHATFAEANGRLAATWPHLEVEHLVPDFERFPEHGTLSDLDAVDTIDIERALVRRLAVDRQVLLVSQTLFRAEAAHARGEFDVARRAAKNARQRAGRIRLTSPDAEGVDELVRRAERLLVPETIVGAGLATAANALRTPTAVVRDRVLAAVSPSRRQQLHGLLTRIRRRLGR